MFWRAFIAPTALLAATLTAPAQSSRAVRLSTADDVGIVASFYPAATEHSPAAVLVHGLNQTRDVWSAFASLLQQNGIAALALDLRGHGDSNRRLTASGPQLVDAGSFAPRDYQDMLLDVNAAVDWLQEQPDINRRRIAVIGASLGANLALRYATVNDELAALLLLSPGIVYRGVRTDDAIVKIGPVPLRLVVSRHDAFAFESCKRLIELRKQAGHAREERELTVCTGNLHGTDMLRGVRNLDRILLEWLKETLQPAPPP